MLGYVKYGIRPELVELVKQRLKDTGVKARVIEAVGGLTKADLQNRAKIRAVLRKVGSIMNVKLSPADAERIVRFVVAQRIDPKNTLHLLRLWAMFR